MQRKGFTLIELLVVIIIVGVLTSVALPQYRKSLDRAKAAEAMQLLPAIFEARERWMIENQCRWLGVTSFACDTGNMLSFPKLDIDVKGTMNGDTLQTDFFTYTLRANGQTPQPCVTATPRWGSARGLTNVTISYRGDKFYCQSGNGEEASEECDILNITENRGGCH